jgi:hypothetical protein
MAASSFASGESARFVTTILRWRLILVELPGGRAVDLSAAPAFNRSPVALEHCKLGRRFFPAMSQHSKPTFGPPLIATAIAAAGLIAMLLVDHGPWSKPQVQDAQIVRQRNSVPAAEVAGATVTPTEPKPSIEPAAPGPKPVQPAVPDQQKR